jgi:hypothetical protein
MEAGQTTDTSIATMIDTDLPANSTMTTEAIREMTGCNETNTVDVTTMTIERVITTVDVTTTATSLPVHLVAATILGEMNTRTEPKNTHNEVIDTATMDTVVDLITYSVSLSCRRK